MPGLRAAGPFRAHRQLGVPHGQGLDPGQLHLHPAATKEAPRRLLHPKKKTVGVRIPDHAVAQALLAELGEPLLSSTLLLPDQDKPLTQGWEIKDELDHVVDAVLDSGDCGVEPTTVIDFAGRA